jgi:hypothetical protein
VELLSPANGVSEDLRMQAATILGSFAHGKLKEQRCIFVDILQPETGFAVGNDEIVSQIVAAGAIPKLLSALALPSDTPPVIAVQQNIKMLEASTRALKAIYSSGKSDKKDIYTVSYFND